MYFAWNFIPSKAFICHSYVINCWFALTRLIMLITLILEYCKLHIPSAVLKLNMNTSLALINTVCLPFFNGKVLGSHLNKAAPCIWSHLKAVVGASLRERERERAQGREQVRRRRFHIGDATAHMLQGDEVLISALKEYVPCGHVRDLCVFLLFFSTSSFKIQRCCNKRGLKYSQPPKEYSWRFGLQVKNVYANAGYIRACTGC